MTSAIRPEFSHIVRPSVLASDPSVREFDLDASARECAALAGRFGFLAVDYLRASVRLRPVRGSGDFRLAGHLSARVVQSCVVTLDPVTSAIEHDFDLLICDEAGQKERLAETEEDYELYSGDAIDVGEAVAVELALSVDPYPRAPGVSAGSSGEPEGAVTETGDVKTPGNRPFEVLAPLRRPK